MCLTVVAHSKLQENKGCFLTAICSYTEMGFSTPHTKILSELQTFCPTIPFTDVTKTAFLFSFFLTFRRYKTEN